MSRGGGSFATYLRFGTTSESSFCRTCTSIDHDRLRANGQMGRVGNRESEREVKEEKASNASAKHTAVPIDTKLNKGLTWFRRTEPAPVLAPASLISLPSILLVELEAGYGAERRQFRQSPIPN